MADSKSVIKAAKKALKKEDGASMSLSKLVAAAAKKTKADEKEVEAIIRESKKFSLDKNDLVSLNKKREKEESESADISNEKKSAKKSKKGKGKEAPLSSLSASEVPSWRLEHKIIVLPAIEGTDATKIQTNSQYFPFPSFDCCKPTLGDKLVTHCTKVNSFKTPSPIQSQAWPLLTSGKDLVGIAETGSGMLSYLTLSDLIFCHRKDTCIFFARLGKIEFRKEDQRSPNVGTSTDTGACYAIGGSTERIRSSGRRSIDNDLWWSPETCAGHCPEERWHRLFGWNSWTLEGLYQ